MDWSELGMVEVPTGTVTLLLADVEGSTRLWETQPDKMAEALARMDAVVTEAVAARGGVRPVEQGEGDSFVVAFARASDAVACALDLQRAPLDPILLRIGVHTGEVRLRDDANYAGPTINRTARLRDLGHGGQTLLSGATAPLVVDCLPPDAWLTELGAHRLRDLPRPERVVQLCHRDACNDFPPLRSANAVAKHNLPIPLTRFVGRRRELAELDGIVAEHRLVTLTGAGGAGKTRLAIEVAALHAAQFDDGLWYVDLAPIVDPGLVPARVALTLGLPDQPSRSPMDILVRFLGGKNILLVLDNCEHLLDACVAMLAELLTACPRLTIMATSREPLGVPGELTWRVPSLSLAEEAVELFVDRARCARPEFGASEDIAALVGEICRRLDGMPLALELAAARVRSLSLTQIADSLHDRFRLLTGGARTAMRRQQTLQASMDWSHALLTEPERVLFRRLAVFPGRFDLDAAQAVGAGSAVEHYQLMDQLGLLVDKSLVVADGADAAMRYRLLETVRQYAQEKLSESGEAESVRTRHRDHYATVAAKLKSRGRCCDDQLMRWAQGDIDNLRAAFWWSQENDEPETALRLLSSLRPLWLRGGRFREALDGFDAALADDTRSQVAPAVWAQAVADRCTLAGWVGLPSDLDRAQQALGVARRLDDPELLTQSLVARGMATIYDAEAAQDYFTEAFGLARVSDHWSACEILNYQATMGFMGGAPEIARAAGEQGRDLAEAIGDSFFSRGCRVWLSAALVQQGDLAEAIRVDRALTAEVEEAGDLIITLFSYLNYAAALTFSGEIEAASTAASAARAAADATGSIDDTVYVALAYITLVAGDAAAARRAAETAWQRTNPMREVFTRGQIPLAEAALAAGDLVAARRWADDTVAAVPGWWRMNALTVRAFIAMAQDEPEQAERDAHDSLAIAARTQGYLRLADTLECLSRLEADRGNQPYVARLLGAADGFRQRTGVIRFPMYQAGYDAAVGAVRDALGNNDFKVAWAEGAALTTEEAIAYAQRGRGGRKRAATGWNALTPAEHDVVRLVSEGHSNKEVGARLFISPRTVQTHLTHVYTKLGVNSRMQLAQEAARHT